MSEDSQRPEIYQPYAPFVEFYIGNEQLLGPESDILRSLGDHKPKRLLSFVVNLTAGGYGNFSLEVFDPDYVEVEKLILINYDRDTRGSTQGTSSIEGTSTGQPAEYNRRLASVKFRFGYTGKSGEHITSKGPASQDYYAGIITQYTPTYYVNGVNYTIMGSMQGWLDEVSLVKPRIEATFYDMNVFDIIKKLCKFQNWELRGTGSEMLSTAEEIPSSKLPANVLDTSSAVDCTEVRPRTLKIRENETPYVFIKRILATVRPESTKYGNFNCFLSTESPSVNETPKTYLFVGVEDWSQTPVRKYIYMHRRVSDVISFTPSIMGYPSSAVGAIGFVGQADDSLRGERAVFLKDESNTNLNFFGNERADSVSGEDGDFQVAEVISTPKYKNKVEGSIGGKTVLQPKIQIPPDFPLIEISGRGTDRYHLNVEMTNCWLAMQRLMTTATLIVVGDPSPELMPTKVIDVFLFVPVGDKKFKMHWVSNRWWIIGVTHNINNGQYTTTMELQRNGLERGGIDTKKEKISLNITDNLIESLGDAIGPGGMSRVG
jgi:hypothetical protein